MLNLWTPVIIENFPIEPRLVRALISRSADFVFACFSGSMAIIEEEPNDRIVKQCTKVPTRIEFRPPGLSNRAEKWDESKDKSQTDRFRNEMIESRGGKELQVIHTRLNCWLFSWQKLTRPSLFSLHGISWK